MKEVSRDQWQFGEFHLDTRRKVLRHREDVVDMPLKELEVLCMLVRNQGELVTKNELLDEIWEDSFVDESNLSRQIYLLRKNLKSLGADDGMIENVSRRGYRFTGDAKVVEPDEIFVERQTQSRTRIELQNGSPAMSRVRTRIAVFSAAVLIIAAATTFLGYQYIRSEESAEIKSLAVLPFKVTGGEEAYLHAGGGLADILTTRLSSIRNITIRTASSAAGLRDQDPAMAGEKMRVDAVLVGSIYYFGERVRVTARLVRVTDSSVVWAGEFEKFRKDEHQLQNDLALQIVPALAVNLSGGERDALTKQYTVNSDAYDLYLKGRFEWNKRSTTGMIEAQRLFRNAIATDPGFTLAYVGLADTLSTNQASQDEAEILISKALELDPNLAEAHASHGFYLMFMEWRWKEADSAFKRSIALNPNYATAHHWYATLLAIKGETDAAKSEMHRALELNPTSYNLLADLGQLYYFSGDYSTARKYCLQALEIYPDFMFAHEYLHYIYLKTGEFEKAMAEIERADAINNASPHGFLKRPESPTQGDSAFRSAGIGDYLKRRYPGVPVEPYKYYLYAKKYAFLGENERALEYLEKSIHARQFLSVFLKADPVFDRLHSEPRYQKILQKMGLA